MKLKNFEDFYSSNNEVKEEINPKKTIWDDYSSSGQHQENV